LSDIASQRAPPPPGLGHSTAWQRQGLLDRHSSDPTISPLYRDLLAHYGAVALSGPGPVAPTAWGRNPPGQSATSRSTASSVCAANRACASSCSCLVCKEEQARRFRAPGRQMEELGVLGRGDQRGASIGTSISRLSLSRLEANFNLGSHF